MRTLPFKVIRHWSGPVLPAGVAVTGLGMRCAGLRKVGVRTNQQVGRGAPGKSRPGPGGAADARSGVLLTWGARVRRRGARRGVRPEWAPSTGSSSMSAASPVAPSPGIAREIHLLAAPGGLPRPEHIRVVRAPLPHPVKGEIPVRNRYFPVFPGFRTIVGGGVGGAPPRPERSPETRSSGWPSAKWRWPLGEPTGRAWRELVLAGPLRPGGGPRRRQRVSTSSSPRSADTGCGPRAT